MDRSWAPMDKSGIEGATKQGERERFREGPVVLMSSLFCHSLKIDL
jgi:hypothetical protein